MIVWRGVGIAPGAITVAGAIVTAWGLALALVMSGRGDLISHDALLEGRVLPTAGAFVLFLLTWQVMTAAMMLPSSLPMVQLFARASQGQTRPRLAQTAFLAAYFAVWTGFAVAALTSDAGLHRLVDHWRWLDERPALISGVVLIAAGAFQFSPLKERCLDACRNPVSFLWHHYRRGMGAAWRLGLRHGLFCLGCCWALMLVMFAVGVSNLIWMAALTGVMTIEKTASWGRRLAPVVGVSLLAWGVLIVAAGGTLAHGSESHGASGDLSLPGGFAAVAAIAVAGLVVWKRHRADDVAGSQEPRPGEDHDTVDDKVA